MGECICGYHKSERVLHECKWDQMELYNLTWYEGNLATKPWWEKQPAEREKYQAYWDMNEGYEQKESTSSLANESWWSMDIKGKGKLY